MGYHQHLLLLRLILPLTVNMSDEEYAEEESLSNTSRKGDGSFLKARGEAKKGELDEQLKEYINEWRKQRAKEEEEERMRLLLASTHQRLECIPSMRGEPTPELMMTEENCMREVGMFFTLSSWRRHGKRRWMNGLADQNLNFPSGLERDQVRSLENLNLLMMRMRQVVMLLLELVMKRRKKKRRRKRKNKNHSDL